MAPRVFNLKGLRQAIFDQADWAPSSSAEAVKRVNEFIDRAYMRLAQDAPYLFFEQEIRMGVHPDQAPTLDTDLLQIADVGGPTADAWTLETELPVDGSTDALVWEADRKWDARSLLLSIPNPKDGNAEHHLIKIREVYEITVGGVTKVRITLETPWRNNVDTGIEYRVVSDEFTLPADLIQINNLSAMEENTSYPYPLAIIGQTQAEFATFPNNHSLQTAGPPRVAYRREYQAPLEAPTEAPPATVTEATAWVGPEPTGSFEYLITYVWGKQEIWSHNEGPTTQGAFVPDLDRFEPYYESGPSPVTATQVVPVAATTSVLLVLPNITFMLGFDDVLTARYRKAGIKKRIYRRRVSSNDNTIESPNKYFLLDEVDGHITTYTDNGTITPDYKRPFRSVHGYETFRLYPRPEKRYSVILRAIVRPVTMYDDTDMPLISRDGIDLLLLKAMTYLYEASGNPSMARYAKEEYGEVLSTVAKRKGDMRPSNRLRRRRTARVRNRWTWRRDLAGVVKNA